MRESGKEWKTSSSCVFAASSLSKVDVSALMFRSQDNSFIYRALRSRGERNTKKERDGKCARAQEREREREREKAR